VRWMGNNSRRLKVTIGLVACALGVNGASAAYLPKLGPASLRFQKPPVFIASLMIFPPLKMIEDSVSNRVEQVAAAASTNQNDVVVSAEPARDSGPPFATTGTNTPPADPVKVDSGPVVTPQMLLQFFTPNSGTNAPNVIVPSPFQFQLPPPGSAATYNVK
jgi:hypothetical protein